eukprot:jgi/Tetstr1/425590/TSEL_016011.t1
MWLRPAEGLFPASDQPQPNEAATDKPAATPADVLALARVRAWAEYEANTDADDAVICPSTRILLALLEFREDVCRDAVLALPFGDQSQGRAVIHVTVEHSEDREDQPTTPLLGWLTDTITAAGVEMYLHHTEPTLLRVGDDNLCAISLGKEDGEVADTSMRMAVALTSHVALLRAMRLRTIVIYLTESEFDPSELIIHPFS